MRRLKNSLYILGALALAGIALSTLAPAVVAEAKARLYRDADHPARSSAIFKVDVDVLNGGFNNQTLAAVIPPGQKLVLEFVSANCSTSSLNQNVEMFVQMRQADGTFSHFVKLPLSPENFQTGLVAMPWGGAHLVRLYADQHDEGSVRVTVGRYANTGNINCDVLLSGHTVDVE